MRNPRQTDLVLRASAAMLAATCALIGTPHANASGALGIYGIVEKVVLEPDAKAPQRIQVWGAFAYVDGTAGDGLTVSTAKRGYLYFRLPTPADGFAIGLQDAVLKEWADLQRVAGTGQAIGFGQWGYIGAFDSLRPDTRSGMPPYILERGPGNPLTDLRVRPRSEAPVSPALYQTNTGMVKLTEGGSHAAIVQALRDALTR
jgi:hypothetical protein